jgi:hypothetical protein
VGGTWGKFLCRWKPLFSSLSGLFTPAATMAAWDEAEMQAFAAWSETLRAALVR